MKAASHYNRGKTRKIAYFSGSNINVGPQSDLLDQIRAKDLIIVNDSATAPSSLNIEDRNGRPIELRIIRNLDSFRVFAFEQDTWKTPTEFRRPAKIHNHVRLGEEVLQIQSDSKPGYIMASDRATASLLNYSYKNGAMIQYSYMDETLPIWANQTIFASRPWSSEAPSAAFALTWRLVFGIIAKGAKITAISHGAGLSSIGGEVEDQELPFPEISQVSPKVIQQIEQTRRSGGRVIAIGTSVVRAVESAWSKHLTNQLDGLPFLNSLIISEQTQLKVCDGILTGLHFDGESHFKLLSSFSSKENIKQLLQKADESGCLNHEFGDFMLLISGHQEVS